MNSIETIPAAMAEKFAQQYRVDLDDAHSAANLAAVMASITHDPERGPLLPRVRYCVRSGLWTEMHAAKKEPREPVDPAYLPDRSRPPIETLLAEISHDARLVAELALAGQGTRADHRPDLRWHNLLKYLTDDLGWALERIAKSVEEIREVLP